MRNTKFIRFIFLICFSITLSCRSGTGRVPNLNPPQIPGREPKPKKATVTLYEGNNATQQVVCVLRAPSGGFDSFVYDFTSDSDCQNDEARSLILRNVPKGLKIWLYDDSDCTRNDSTTRIIVKKDLTLKKIDGFERTWSDDEVRVKVFKDGNLDGKVSCVIVGFASP